MIVEMSKFFFEYIHIQDSQSMYIFHRGAWAGKIGYTVGKRIIPHRSMGGLPIFGQHYRLPCIRVT